jgi:hypothetical protein
MLKQSEHERIYALVPWCHLHCVCGTPPAARATWASLGFWRSMVKRVCMNETYALVPWCDSALRVRRSNSWQQGSPIHCDTQRTQLQLRYNSCLRGLSSLLCVAVRRSGAAGGTSAGQDVLGLRSQCRYCA